MVSIKSEPLNSLEDDILHVLCVKPEPDVFFDHVSFKNDNCDMWN